MVTSTRFVKERTELETVLASGIFHRAPNLALLLTYICSKYFAGASEQIKEYNIAVDALGRPDDFDQKRDSIVRVEAHRLRKRLREYYETDGAGHEVRIEIPAGQYAPQFRFREAPPLEPAPAAIPVPVESGPQTATEVAAEIAAPAPAASMFPSRQASWRIFYCTVFLLALSSGAVAVRKAPWLKSSHAADGAAAIAPAPASGSDEILILAGHTGSDYTDRQGRVWQSDRYFNGGRAFETVDHPIFGTREPRIYQNRREGAFTYDIPLSPGVYELRLHFAETLYGENNIAGGAESTRLFNVYINGSQALREFDLISDAGPSTADIRAFKDISPGPDGQLHLRFEAIANPPVLSAIEITPGIPGRFKPIRMIALERPYTDRQGRVWEPERYVRSGQLVTRSQPVQGAPDPELFRGERYGNLRYVIPVPPGRYGVTIHFSEAWFGPGTPAGGGIGSRLFDILANGILLRRDFDVFKEAGGPGRATIFTAHGLEPDAQGKLNIALKPSRNYACINAIEVLDESK